MKKWTLLFTMLGGFALSGVAQDDMYFVPSKKNIAKEKAARNTPTEAYYCGSNRSVEEYNRRGSSYEVLPADTGDIISFAPVEGIYPDSTVADFELTRKMARWDDYSPSDAYWQGYRSGRNDAWSWHSPWYYSSYYSWYDPWYYDPWYGYYGGYWGGWYDPWYYGYGWGYPYYSSYYWGYPWHHYGYGWGYPYYYYGGGGGYVSHRYGGGTQNHGRVSGYGPSGFANGRSHSYSGGTFGGRNVGSFGGSRSSASRSAGTTRTVTTRQSGTYSNSSGNFGGSRSSGSTYTPSRSSSTSGGGYSGGGGSFGGGGGGGGFR